MENQPAVQDSEKQARTWAMACHLSALVGILGPLIVWLIKKDENKLIDENGKEALNFQISIMIYFAGAFLLTFILIGIPLMFALGIANLVLIVTAAVKVSNGESYKYPMAIRLIK